jgi:hypothetical protein
MSTTSILFNQINDHSEGPEEEEEEEGAVSHKQKASKAAIFNGS